jgi:prepilin-type N-terminal cleavage/methylation domain-containing protein
MKTRFQQSKTSGVTLIEVLAVIVVFLIVSASIRIVSDSGPGPKLPTSNATPTNGLPRDFHAPHNTLHAPP